MGLCLVLAGCASPSASQDAEYFRLQRIGMAASAAYLEVHENTLHTLVLVNAALAPEATRTDKLAALNALNHGWPAYCEAIQEAPTPWPDLKRPLLAQGSCQTGTHIPSMG